MNEDAPSPAQETEWVAAARDGDRAAFGELVRAHMRKAYTLAYQLVGNHADADDVAQGAFLKAYQSLDRFRGEAGFATWLHRITVNQAMDVLRKRKHRLTFSDCTPDGAAPVDPPSPEMTDGPAVERDRSRSLWKCLDRLKPEIRAAAVMVYLRDLTPREAARQLGCAEATVHWRLFRARNQLRRLWPEEAG